MSENAPTVAPAATPAAAPASTHHSALQPREVGKFAGPPDPTKAPTATPAPDAPPPPKSWRLGDREITNPDDLYTEAAAARAEREALADHYKRAAEAEKKAKELEAKLADPRGLLTPEQRHAMLVDEARRWQEEEEIKALPPEQQKIIRLKQQIDRERAALDAEKAERDRLAKEAADAKAKEEDEKRVQAMREEFATYATASLTSVGLEETSANYMRVATQIRGMVARGVRYPPEVIGAKVKAQVQAERRGAVESASVDDLLSEANLKKLASVEDPAVLRKLAAVLGDKLRRINLAELGLTPVAVPKPTSSGAASGEPDFPPGDPRWEKHLRDKLRRG